MLKKIKKLIEWLPIIWKDEDWDFAYLLILIKYKLSRMEKIIGSNKSFAAQWEDRKLELVKAQLLISNYQDDPVDEWILHFNRWHGPELGFKDCDNAKACHKANTASYKRERRNWASIWNHISKYGEGWWDVILISIFVRALWHIAIT